MPPLRYLFAIGCLGAAGALTRYLLSGLVSHWFGGTFPSGTLFVNGLGCFLIGVIAELSLATNLLPEAWRVGLTVGLLGGLTTFSTFGYETYQQIVERNHLAATGYVLASLAVGLAAVWAGVATARFAVDVAGG